MVEEIRKQCVISINSADIELVSYSPIGQLWVQRFLKCHSELAGITCKTIKAARVKDTSYERLSKWFDDLVHVIDEFDIKPKNIYNMDKSRFSIRNIEATYVIINSTIHQ